MTPPRLLDLFCGVGGASAGYAAAGFEVVGVDLVRQPEYPFTFVLADALTFPLDGFDVVHAGPPCKRWTVARRVAEARFATLFDPHPDLLVPIRARLAAAGVPYVIENVPGTPLLEPVVYCGSSFGLGVRRHRLFESNVTRCRQRARITSSRTRWASTAMVGPGRARRRVVVAARWSGPTRPGRWASRGPFISPRSRRRCRPRTPSTSAGS